ncbi:hypothetical protein GTW25_16975 [Aliihoeflea aestuarii]|uniref:SH3 domain-containing protein n=1 Tax=Aliihoeflea aestuarii TaxID=453840 RepID=UPI00209509F5|nr:SH3 domain-containing protein [Aliihoeflea aestuarii]MCO6392721.1 hypothetical protein [Aliihoeflea aestuarii]
MVKFMPGTISMTLAMLVSIATALPAGAQSRMSVTDDANVRRTCPSLECGVVGRFHLGESIVVYESVDGWSRVSEYYTAGCFDGHAAFVDSGSDACTAENGIRNGELAEWIRSDFLSTVGDIAG